MLLVYILKEQVPENRNRNEYGFISKTKTKLAHETS